MKYISSYSNRACFNLLFPSLVFLTMQAHLQVTQLHPFLNFESLILSAILLCGGVIIGTLLNLQKKLLSSIILGCLIAIFLNHVFDWEVIGIRMRYIVPVFFLTGFLVYWFLQNKIITILLPGIAAIFVSTFLLPSETAWKEVVGERTVADGTNSKASIIHIILDGHLGLEAFPKEIPGSTQLKSSIADTYIANEFKVFGRAFSRHNNTHNAISELLNLRELEKDAEFIDTDSLRGFVLNKSSVFESYLKQGYTIKVHQTDAMDYCSLDTVNYCLTAPYKRLYWLSDSRLSLSQKTHVLVSTFLNRSTLWRWAHRYLNRYIQIPVIRKSFPPKNMVEMVTRISADIDSLKRGTVLFAHILLPHEPPALNSSCDLRPPQDWFSNDQKERYIAYFAQMECTNKLMERILSSVNNNPDLDDATIVVHGDHGSRMGLEGVDTRLFTYATLMAIRTPGLVPGYARDKESVPTLFSKHVIEKLGLLDGTAFRTNTIAKKIAPGGGFVSENMPEF